MARARQAVQDFGASFPVEVVAADHQQKPDVASSLVREWFDRAGVDAVTDVNNNAIIFTVTGLAQAADRLQLNTGAFSADITGRRSSPNQIHWGSEFWQIAKKITTVEIAAGHDKWFLLVADYAFGAAMQRDMTSFIASAGWKVAGAVGYPLPGTSNFSFFPLQAQASGANVIAFANAAREFVNSVKQAREFGLTAQGMTLAGLVVFVTDIHALGLETVRGLRLTEGLYWI